MLPSGPTTTSLGWLNWPSALPALPATPRLRSFSPFGLNLCTWCPLVPCLLAAKSAIHTLPSLSTEIPCGVTITPLPKLASTLPVCRSNLKRGSTGVLSQSTGPPPAVPAPQRSYPQILPSFGSISRPADVPHLRPAGNSPQLRVTFGAGFGSPSPVIGFAAFAADCADNVARESGLLYAVSRKRAQAPNMEIRILGVGMTPPRKFQGLSLISVPGRAATGEYRSSPACRERLPGSNQWSETGFARCLLRQRSRRSQKTRRPGAFGSTS